MERFRGIIRNGGIEAKVEGRLRDLGAVGHLHNWQGELWGPALSSLLTGVEYLLQLDDGRRGTILLDRLSVDNRGARIGHFYVQGDFTS